MKNLILAGMFLALFVGCAQQPTPEDAYKKISAYVENKDWGSLYDSFDTYSKGQMDSSIKMLASVSTVFADDQTKQQIASLSGRDLFIRIANNTAPNMQQNLGAGLDYKILKTEKAGDKATITIRKSDGSLKDVSMLFENKEWKLVAENNQLGEASKANVSLSEKIKQQSLSKEMQDKAAAEQEKMNHITTIALVSKTFVPEDSSKRIYDDYLSFEFAIENQTDKNIKAMKIMVTFKDTFGDEIFTSFFKLEENLTSKQKLVRVFSWKFNQFDAQLMRLKNIDFKNIVLDARPVTVIFEDGTKLGE